MEKTYVIKLGGSLLSDSKDVPFDFAYLKEFSKILREHVEQGYRFVLVTGGGYMMRELAKQAEKAGITNENDLHWIGTTYNNVNAEITRAYISDIANSRILSYEEYYDNEKTKFEKGKSVVVGGGGRAGHSGDMDALLCAKEMNINTVISLKNVDGVYTADPKKDPSATRLDQISWEEYFNIIGNIHEHPVGGNFPIDPVTSEMAKEAGKRFIVVSGEDIANLEKVFAGDNYIGTVVA